ncbi:MAG: caspase family protein [Saprospiraceae bacterium]
MRHVLTSFLLCIAFALYAQSGLRTGKDYAVLFAVANFKETGWSKLPETWTEADSIATELRNQFGFITEVLRDPTGKQILAKIEAYNQKTYDPDDQVLFFFSSHGQYDPIGDEGFLIPADGKIIDPYGESWISYERLGRYVTRNPCKHVLISLDACYSGSFGTRSKSGPAVLPWQNGQDCGALIRNMLKYKTRRYVCSGSKEKRTPARSLFARSWLEALRTGGEDGILALDDLERFQARIENPEPEKGTFNGHEPGGNFVFVRKTACLAKVKELLPADQRGQAIIPSNTFHRWTLGFYPIGFNGAMRLGKAFNESFLKGSNIINLPETIIQDFFDKSAYRAIERHRFSYAAGLFCHRRWSKFPWVSTQADIIFSRQAGGYDYNNVDGLYYSVLLDYWYSTVLLSGKFYPGAKVDKRQEGFFAGFFCQVGLLSGFNLTQKSLFYNQWPESTFGPSKQVEDILKTLLKGRPDLGWFGGIGYEFALAKNGNVLNLEARYHHGMTDVIRVEPNGYNFRDNKNFVRSLEITIGLGFSL